MPKKYRPKLPKDSVWRELVDLVREVGVERAYQTLTKQDDFKTEFNSKNETVQYKGSRVTNLEELKEVGQINEDKWEVDRYIENFWGNDLNPNWQVKAWLKRKGMEDPSREWTDKWLDEVLGDVQLPDIKISRKTGKPVVMVITDLHVGVINEDDRVVPTYNKDKCMVSILEAVEMVNDRYPDRPVHLLVLGDLIESFTGKNKKDTWKQIELHGAKASFCAFDILHTAVKNLDNFKKMYMISGNHDRVTDHRQADQEGQVAEIVYETFKRATNVPIEYDQMVLSPQIDGIQYIMLHGDNRLVKKSSAEIVQQYGDSNVFNLIVSGHKHHREFIDDTYNSRHILHPSIVTGTPFSLRLGATSRSGYAVHERSEHGSVNSTIYDL